MQKIRGFTLIELIVVITILGILSTIAFISLQGFSQKSRNSVRISDIKSIENVLELYALDNVTYPSPSDGIDITYSGSTLWTQGTFGESSRRQTGRISQIPVDPLTGNEYTFSLVKNKVEYELGAILEGGSITTQVPLVNSTYAGNTYYKSYTKGNYNGKVITASFPNTTFILAVPTIINGDISLTDIVDIITEHKLSYNGYGTLPGSYLDFNTDNTGEFNFSPNNIVVFSGSLDDLTGNDSDLKRVSFLKELQESYNGTILESDSNYKKILYTFIDLDHISAESKNVAINIINSLLNSKIPADNIDGVFFNLPSPVAHYMYVAGQDGISNQIIDGPILNKNIENNISGFINDSDNGLTLIGKGYYTRIYDAPAPAGRVKVWFTTPPSMGHEFTTFVKVASIGGGRRGCSKISDDGSMLCRRYGSSRLSTGINITSINTNNIEIQVGGRSGSHSSKQGSDTIIITDFRVYKGTLNTEEKNLIIKHMNLPSDSE